MSATPGQCMPAACGEMSKDTQENCALQEDGLEQQIKETKDEKKKKG